jgi:hypothetical protein
LSRYRAYRRGNRVLPLVHHIGWIARFIQTEKTFAEIRSGAKLHAASNAMSPRQYHLFWSQCVKALEVLVSYGWAEARVADGYETCPKYQADLAEVIHPNQDVAARLSDK